MIVGPSIKSRAIVPLLLLILLALVGLLLARADAASLDDPTGCTSVPTKSPYLMFWKASTTSFQACPPAAGLSVIASPAGRALA